MQSPPQQHRERSSPVEMARGPHPWRLGCPRLVGHWPTLRAQARRLAPPGSWLGSSRTCYVGAPTARVRLTLVVGRAGVP